MTTTLSAGLDAAKVAGIQTSKLTIKSALKQQEEAMEQENYIPVRTCHLERTAVS